jgi:hypothetical protein
MRRFLNHPLPFQAGLILASALLVACGDGDGSRARGAAGAADHSATGAGEGSSEAEALERQAVHLSAEQERALGVVYVTVTRETLTRSIRTVGRIAAAEPNVADVTPKIEAEDRGLHRAAVRGLDR